MSHNEDFKDRFRHLNEEQVEYLVVGAHAVIFYTEPRFTKDLDIWVLATRANAEKVWKALGAPLSGVSLDDLTNEELVYQIGVAPNRIDVLMGIAGVDFEEAHRNRVESTYAGERIHIIGKPDLIRAKKATYRKQDQLDLEKLTEFES